MSNLSELIGEQGWDHFTKRELLAARLLEKMLAPNTIYSDGGKDLARRAVEITDQFFVALTTKHNESGKGA